MSSSQPNSGYVQLLDAIKKKDKATAQNLILSNIRVNIPHARDVTPLHWAIIKFEDLDIVTMLLDTGADIHATTYNDKKPLEVAIHFNNTQAALLLIKRGALVEEDLNSFLIMAIEKNNAEIAKILIDERMKFNPSIDLKIFLNAAISQGQSKIIEHILPHCRFLNPSDKYIPKEAVIYFGPQYQECVELLLKWNFTVNPDSKNDEEFVYAAVENGHLPIVSKLLELGIDVNMKNSDTGLNLLKVACLYEHYEIVENLLKHNACVNVTTPTNTKLLKNLSHYNCNYPLAFIYDKNILRDITCLHIAVLNSDPKMTNLLLRYGATIIDDPKFFTITCISVRNNYEEIIRLFLDCGINVNDIDSEEKSLLHFCVLPTYDGQDSRYNITKLLLEKGANLHIQTPGNSLLFKAIKIRHHKIARLFLDYNADVQYISRHGNTLLHKAIENNFDDEFIEILLKHNSSVNAVNNDMLTPLHVACQIPSVNQLQIVKTLVDYNANVNCTVDSANINSIADLKNSRYLNDGMDTYDMNDKGRTPLHFVCKYKTNMTQTIIQLLLQHNANIEAVDARGWTPLFVACKTNNDLAVKCLLQNHANANRIDSKKLTPLYIAATSVGDNSDIVKILLEHKVNVHCMNKRGNSIIHVVVNRKNADLIKYLAHTQINFNSINKDGNTPLHVAVRLQGIDTARNLIKYGANVNTLNKKKRTALGVAIKCMSDFENKVFGRNNSDNATHPNVKIYKEIIKNFTIQIVKLKVAGLKVNNQNLKIVYHPDNYVTNDDEENTDKINILQLEVECEKEIEKMKTESIGVNNITFHNLLTRNIHFLCRFVKNKKIRQTLELEVYDEKFPLYMDIIRSRFRDAKFRYRMMNSAEPYFISNITQRLPDDCIDSVFSYFNIKDLKIFIRYMKPLNG